MKNLTSEALERIFDKAIQDEHDRFWLSWEYVTLHHPVAYKRSNHFLELYGFSRNSAMSFLIVALMPLSLPWMSSWSPPINAIAWSGLSMLAGLILFSNYIKLFRRMNDEVYRGLVTAWKVRQKSGATKADNA